MLISVLAPVCLLCVLVLIGGVVFHHGDHPAPGAHRPYGVGLLFHFVLHGRVEGYPIQTQRLPFPGLWEYATVDKRSVITLDLEENRKAFFESVA